VSTQVINLGKALDLDHLFEGKFKYDSYGRNEGDVLDGTPEGGKNDTFATDHFCHTSLAANPHEYRGYTLYDYYNFSGWTKGNFHRTEFQGPLVEGPQAALFELGVSVTAHMQPDEVAYLIEEGTVIILKGTTYKVHFPNRVGQKMKYPELVKISE
jgi:hypothetical protein